MSQIHFFSNSIYFELLFLIIDLSYLFYRRMQKQFVIPLTSKDGKQIHMEVKQKHQEVTKRKVKTWTTEQDNQLLQIYQQHPKKWADIAALMDDRNQNQCLHRYRRLSQLGKSHKIWSSEEDDTIRKLIKKYGKNWKLLSEMLGSKNGKQIRERFINKLDPKINKDDWTEEEDKMILQLYSRFGSKWSQISKHLHGRPENKIKNRFYSFIRKNYDITFKEFENNDPSMNQLKPETKSICFDENTCLVDSMVERSYQMTENKEQGKKSEEKIYSKFEIPSINQMEFQIKHENGLSHNLLDSVLRDQQWKNANIYQSIIELNSDMFIRYES